MNWFKRSPESYEARGDMCAEIGDWAQAKLEYKSALELLEKDRFVTSYRKEQLYNKYRSANDSVVLGHLQNAKHLIEESYFDDAIELLELIITITDDETITGETLQLIEKVQQQEIFSVEEAGGEGGEEEDTSIEDDDDVYFSVLVESIHESMQKDYYDYGESFRKGYLALNRGDFELAAEGLAKAMQENPPSSFVAVELASALVNLERYAEARVVLEGFIEHCRNYLPAYQMLCEIYWEKKEYTLALTLLDDLPPDLADSVDAHTLLGQSRYRAGQYPESRDIYLDILDRYGWDNTIAIQLAEVYEAMDEPLPASQVYGNIMADYSKHREPLPVNIKRKFSLLSFAAGEREPSLLQMNLSLVKEDPDNACDYYRMISQIYFSWDDEEAAQQYYVLSKK